MSKPKVHPMAALFPMLSAEELKELATDIKENGLQQAIMLDKDGLLVDGRNREAACEIAKVKPEYETLNGIDAETYIISQNLARRHMNPGQRAMVVAMMYPEKHGPGGRGQKGSAAEQFPMVSKTSLSYARKVVRLASDLAPNVLSGAVSLEQAYLEARNRQQLAESDESKMQMLREQARDLAGRVEEGMALNEAIAALQERKRKDAEIVAHGKQAAETGISSFLAAVASIVAAAKATDEKIIDKKRVNQVVKAVEHLQALV